MKSDCHGEEWVCWLWPDARHTVPSPLRDHLEIAGAASVNAREQAEDTAGFAGSTHPVFLFGSFILFCLQGEELDAGVEHRDGHIC